MTQLDDPHDDNAVETIRLLTEAPNLHPQFQDALRQALTVLEKEPQ